MKNIIPGSDNSANLKETKQQQVYAALKEAIINSKYQPGTMLVERELCELYNVSRTPVREALRQLANDGMVELVTGRGVFVAKLSFENMIEIYEIREALEKMAIKLFILKNDDGLKHKLEQCFQEQLLYEQTDPQRFMEKDMEFHFIIAEGSRNKQIVGLLKNSYDQIQLLAYSSEKDQRLRSMAHSHHRAILDAIISSDVKSAEKCIIAHIDEIKSYHLSKYMIN